MYRRGSEWRRWDLHVHTPYSILNNQFGSDFDTYVVSLFTKAIELEIAAIGITDYFSINGYKKIKRDYLANKEKMSILFPDNALRSKIANILLLPNIEFRLDSFIGERSHAANYHVIFSDDVSIDDIENKFLGQLQIPISVSDGRPRSVMATSEGITELGRHIKSVQATNGNDYKVGLENATVNLNSIVNCLNGELCFKDRFLLLFPSDEDWSNVPWNGRDGNIRRQMIQSADMLFASNPNTISWALGELSETPQEYINEFHKFRPCISSSDAHSISDLFRNDNERYCWIKANPTFNGLKQTLYEPKERVRISATMPESKSDYQIIRSVRFIDELFPEEPILFNDKLTCIIGGKSTGKSLLLQNIAYCIDRNQVEAKTKITKSNVRPVENMEVTWGDGRISKLNDTTSSDKIIYIPQTYLNRLSDEQEESTEVDIMIQDTLLQDNAIAQRYSQLTDNLDNLKRTIDQEIYNLIATHKQFLSTSETRAELGNSTGIEKEIKKLDQQKTDLLNELDVSTETIAEFDSLTKDSSVIKNFITDLEQDKKFMQTDFSVSLNVSDYSGLKTISPERISEAISSIQELIDERVNSVKASLVSEIDRSLEQQRAALERQMERIEEIRPAIIRNQSVLEIEKRLSAETEKLQKVLALEKQEKELFQKISGKLDDLSNLQEEFFELYNQYTIFVNEHSSSSIDDMEFRLETVFRRERFEECLKKIIDNRTVSRFNDFSLKSFEPSNYTQENLKKIALSIMKSDASSLELKAGINLESALREIFSDWYNINYIVRMEDDLIHDMSPGKKALVLLKLLIGMAQSNTPILIDQPEDDLDNRSIFDDLVKYIKRRKIDRQIIVVTHNANIVVGGDAEQIIIANQDGKNAPNHSHKFEYRSGAIEDDSCILDDCGNIKLGVLNRQGIQSHICELLEGGTAAFELRKNKYFIL